jgi:hypothetical protein
MTLPTSAGTAGYVLSTDGNGNTSWIAQSGGSNLTIDSLTSSNFNFIASGTGLSIATTSPNTVAYTWTMPSNISFNNATTTGNLVVQGATSLATTTVSGNLTAVGTVYAGGFGPASTSSSGFLALSGSNSGTVTVTAQPTAGTWIFSLPSAPAAAHQWLTTDINGVATFTQPSYSDISGTPPAGGTTFTNAPMWTRFLGNGSEGAVNCSGSIVGGEHWVTTFTISSGVTCTENASNEGLIIRATGACTIAGTLNANGVSSLINGEFGGTAGGGGGGAAAGGLGANSATILSNSILTGGTAGAASSTGGNGNPWSNMSAQQAQPFLANGPFFVGAGKGGSGGSSGPTGGSGGGFVALDCASINFTGTINANGANGATSTGNNVGASGGGGGGFVILATPSFVATSGTISTLGGSGGSCSSFTGCGTGGNGGNGSYQNFTIY